ncbi:hypothetical protein ACI7YT_12525 [Microbacterium sp. M]|uniref:hypothetical protein n=1 Tax=Microbacterium sp. M TaxID=3377125 RepID=UPI00386A70BE
MTYMATRYARTPGRVHECPESGGYNRHNLIRDPEASAESGLYVCPYDYEQERGARFQERLEAEAASERQEQAEKIAQTVRTNNGHGLNDRQIRMDGNELHRLLTAAAIAALAERESA